MRHCITSRKVRFPIFSLGFFIDINQAESLLPCIRLSLSRNEYQEYFLGGKGGRYVGLTTLPPSSADGHEIWKDCFTFVVTKFSHSHIDVLM
jgi:hypothetical protein